MPGKETHNTQLLSKLKVLTFFVTARCNSKCDTCFYWKRLNREVDEELTIGEIERISLSMPSFAHLLVSGGEPFLREDLEEIIGVFSKNNNIATVDIPTNGLLTETIVDKGKSIIEGNPNVNVIIGVSIDGFEKTHDKIRGVEGGFRRAVQTINKLAQLRNSLGPSDAERFQVLCLVCISNRNYEEIPDLIRFFEDEFDIDGIGAEIVRGNPKDRSIQLPELAKIKTITDAAIDANRRLFFKNTPKIAKLKLSYIKKVYETQRKYLRKGRLPFICQAGVRLAVLEQNGDVRLCELLDCVGNVRDFDYDFGAVWKSEPAQRQRRMIVNTRCSCTHCVNLGHSIDDDTFARISRKLSALW